MRSFDVQSVEIAAPAESVFRYLADAARLPEWTAAFASVNGRQALMRTPSGTATVDLVVHAWPQAQTVDWEMRFASGEVARAWSRVVSHGEGAIVIFVLPAPPVPLEQLEGTLAQQSATLAHELRALAAIVAGREART